MTVMREMAVRLKYLFRPQDRRALNDYERGQARVRRGAAGLAATNKTLAASNAGLAASNVGLATSFAGIGKQLAALGVIFGTAFSAKEISDAGNAMDDLENRIRAIEGADAPIRAIRRELTLLAQENYSGIEDITQVFQRFRLGTEDLGKSRAEIIRFTDLVTKAGITSGSSAVETNAALIQFAQGIASDRFSGEEFRSVAEQLPTILRVLKRDLEVSTGELREMAHAGQLTAEVIFTAFDNQEQYIRDTFQQLAVTRGLAFSQFRSGVTTFFGAFAQGSRFNQEIASMLQFLGKWFVENEDAARRWGMATEDAIIAIGDGIGAAFGFIGGGNAMANGFAAMGNALSEARQFLRFYAGLREAGFSRGNAFDETVAQFFGEDSVERFREIAGTLKNVARIVGAMFAAPIIIRTLKFMGKMLARGGVLWLGFKAVEAVTRAWNMENSNLKALWEKLASLWQGDFGDALRKLGGAVLPVINAGFRVLTVLIDKVAQAILFLVEQAEAFMNTGFVKTLGKLVTGSEIDLGDGFKIFPETNRAYQSTDAQGRTVNVLQRPVRVPAQNTTTVTVNVDGGTEGNAYRGVMRALKEAQISRDDALAAASGAD